MVTQYNLKVEHNVVLELCTPVVLKKRDNLSRTMAGVFSSGLQGVCGWRS